MKEQKDLLGDFGAAKSDTDKASPARTPTKKTGSTAKKSTATSGSSSAKGDQVNAKNQSAKDKKKPDRVKVSTATEAKAKKEKASPDASSESRSAKTVHRIIPYVLILFAVFIAICLLLNLICNIDNQLSANPSEHIMGVFGYHLSTFLLGLFGPAVFVLPLLLVNLAIFWKKFVDNSMLISKILVSLAFLLIFASLIHTFCLPSYMDLTGASFEECNWTAGELMDIGAKTSGGGLFGGKLGYMMVMYLNVVGSLLVGFLLLIASLFFILGVTPKQIWRYLRRNAGEKASKKSEKEDEKAIVRKESRSETEAEDAHKQAQMDEKIRKITAKDGSTTVSGNGVEVVRPAPQKKGDADKLAPMPMPRLDPTDGSRPFVPGDIGRKMNEESRAQTQAQAQAQQPTPAPINPAQNRDTAVDPIFPKSNEAKLLRRVPRQDRNFDLNKVFIDLEEDEHTPTERQHAPVPPEVPLSQSGTSAADKIAQQGAGTKALPDSASRTRSAVTVQNQSTKQNQPTIHEAAPEQTEFGLTPEEFERLEAQQGILVGTKTATDESKASPKKSTESASTAPKAAAPIHATPTQPKEYVFPPISYLQPGVPMTAENRAEIEENTRLLSQALESFHVKVDDIKYSCGPTVTRYEIVLAPGVRVRSVTNLADDIALALRSPGGVRIEAPIPGTNAVGIEIPNRTRSTIYLRDMIESKKFTESTSKLSACLGADIAGAPLIFDIAKMPHLLVAGTTGSGKSVCINCIITSLLYRVRPDEVKLILIDPKKVEFSIYKNIPHLMAPVVTLPKDAAGALQAAVEEMERRFEIFETVGVRDLKGYNTVTKDDPDMPFIPHIVIIIDELADLMMTARNEVETAICRIAQKARAAGMHLIIGTQRPSADVVTGLIKANVPSSIAFAVKSQIDSRVILDHGGAEALTGRGDMLFVPIGSMRDTRVQGAFVDDKEVEKICDFIRATNGTAVYDERFTAKLKELAAQCGNKGKNADDIAPIDGEDLGNDPKYNDAVRVAVEEGRISTSLLQRKLGVGYSRAAKLIDRMQAEEIVSPPDGSKPRSILITPEQYIERFVDNAEESAESEPEA